MAEKRDQPSLLPGKPLHPVRRAIRYWVSRTAAWLVVRAFLRPRLVGRDRLPPGPAVYCFNHLNWTDPFILMAVLPFRPRLYFFGPKEEDMAMGGRNRLMSWTRTSVAYRPGKSDLLDATRRVGGIIATGGVLAIAGEGRIHSSERELTPLNVGPAYFALRSGVHLVPLATGGRPTSEAIDKLTADCSAAILALVHDAPELARPGPVGRWLTELFNDWPEGSRPPIGPSTPTV